MQKEEKEKIDSKRIDIQPHAKVRSRRARQLAEERAKTRFVDTLSMYNLLDRMLEFGNVIWPNRNEWKNKHKNYHKIFNQNLVIYVRKHPNLFLSSPFKRSDPNRIR